MNLVIAEKHSVAKTISDVIGATTKKDGYWEGNGYIVTHCVGHLVSYVDPDSYDEKYKFWNISDLPILPKEWKFAPVDRTKKQLNIINDLMKRADVETVVNACDAGREGEMICMELYEYFKCKKPVKRLWITSLEEKSIRDGFDNLRPGKDYESLYDSAICRSQADWLVGMNYTRLYTKLYDTETQNIGRVMTPTLAMIVRRDEEIRNFVKVPFFVVHLKGSGFTAESARIEQKAAAEEIAGMCNGKMATVASVETKPGKAHTPQLYDLTSLQKDANDLFGYTAATTLETAQKLYEMKILTYPRTDSKFITDDMAGGIPNLAKSIKGIMPYELELTEDREAQGAGSGLPAVSVSPEYVGYGRFVKNAGVTDHHAILPTGTAATTNVSALTQEQRDILTMVCTRLFCALGAVHKFTDTKVKVTCEGHEFSANGKTITDIGWKAILEAFESSAGKQKNEKDKSLPELTQGHEYVAETLVHDGKTEPKKPYTEASLLAAMEKAGLEDMPDDAERKGIGTPATRAETIEKLIRTNFIERKKKNLLSLTKGQNLIKVLSDDDPIKEPRLTGEWETKLKEVERGNIKKEAFISEVEEYISNAVEGNRTPTDEGKALLPPRQRGGGGGKKEYAESEIIKKCPRCDGTVVEKQKAFGCAVQGCKYVLFKENMWFENAKKKLTPAIAKSLLVDGSVLIKEAHSEKSGKKYDVILKLNDNGKDWLKFDLEFPKK